MSEALPALGRGEINSVIALLGKPPPEIWSRNSRPVGSSDVAGTKGWGKRAANSFLRSTTFLADMPNPGTSAIYVQVNISEALCYISGHVPQIANRKAKAV